MTSTLPKKWEAEGWVDLGSDVNWSDYHGMWGKKCKHDQAWYVLRYTNLLDACGERDCKQMGVRYECSVFRVDLNDVPRDKRRDVLKSFMNWEQLDERAREIYLVYGLVNEGFAAPLHEEANWNHPARVRARAKREADAIMNDYDKRESLLDRPVNAIGSTAREFGQGDVLAGLRRYERDATAPADPSKDLMLKMQGRPLVKMVKQANLTAECWMVQIYGTSHCSSCEFKDTDDCGGPEIRKSGKNEKGIEVGRMGL